MLQHLQDVITLPKAAIWGYWQTVFLSYVMVFNQTCPASLKLLVWLFTTVPVFLIALHYTVSCTYVYTVCLFNYNSKFQVTCLTLLITG